ncbi:unnamed protein product [Auanema sp. JU1783]|nr:unnamed protein product [Auanema sp. JU1783]
MFKALRRLHGQNLESRGLNDMSEAFQSFVTRARFFSVGKLRRTWSHSAVEFMKYRRLLPMILADGQEFENMETDDFDAALAFQANSVDDRKVTVTNIPSKVTQSQLQSFFSQFGKVSHCSLPSEKRSLFGALSKTTKNCGTAVITFKRKEEAEKTLTATEDQLKFYDSVMTVSKFVSKRKGCKGIVLADDTREESVDSLSRASSSQSLSSTSKSIHADLISLGDFNSNILEYIFCFLPIYDTVKLERVNKKFMEASVKSWSHIRKLSFGKEYAFGKHNPLRTSHLRAILRRAGPHLKSFDLSGTVHLLDDKALAVIAQCCPELEEIDLSGVQANWEAFGELSESLVNLKKLSYRDMPTVSDKSVWYLMRNCTKSLSFLDLRGCSKLHGRFTKLLTGELEMLYLDSCLGIDSMAFEDLCTTSTSLKELRINECYNITDEVLSIISRRMEDLQVLTLCGDKFSHLSSAGLSHITRLTNLTELALDYNPLVDDAFLVSLSQQAVNMKTISLANAGTDQSITDRGLNALAKLGNLEQIDISSIGSVRSGTLLEIAYACKLQILQVRNCTYLSDEGVKGLARCKYLKHLDLSGSLLITSDSIQTLIKSFPNDVPGNVTVVVGGTAVDSDKLSIRGSRVIVDFSDYSSIMNLPSSQSSQFKRRKSVDNDSDDEFEAYTAQRSFYIDGICGDDSPMENEKELQEWAEKEARELGLIGK